ncbi:MAG: MnhB domain-containing protein [Kiritimatiellae bacterium]|nr:MnhB domain-containing protein [Kiritimatiellia bacterium]
MSGGTHQGGMSLIVRTVTRWLKAFILLFGIYVVLYGHVSPGGGFAGGVVIACAYILLTLAEGRERTARLLSERLAAVLAVAGLLFFLGVGLAGMVGGRAFLDNFLVGDSGAEPALASGGIIELCEIAIGIIVSMSLFLAFAVLSRFRVSLGDGDETATGEGGAS